MSLGPPAVRPGSLALSFFLDANLHAGIKLQCKPAHREFAAEQQTFLQSRDYCRYNEQQRYFFIRLSEYERASYRLKEELNERYRCSVAFNGFSREFINAMRVPDASSREQRRQTIDDKMRRYFDTATGLYATMKDYQRLGVRFVVENDFKCIIGDEMGLGKSLQAICVYKYLLADARLPPNDRYATLVLCPSSLRIQWSREFIRWLPEDCSDDDFLVVLKGKDLDQLQSQRFVIISYDLASLHINRLRAVNWAFFIADESHMIKNKDAKRTKMLQPMLQRIPYRLLLSGTPALSKPEELWTQVRTLRPELFPNYRAYTTRYCEGHELPLWRGGSRRNVWVAEGCSNPIELYFILTNGGLMIRRKKKDVLTQLPAKLREQILLPVTLPKALEGKMAKMRRVLAEKRKYYAEKVQSLERFISTHMADAQRQAQLQAARRSLATVERGKLPAEDRDSTTDKYEESILELVTRLPSIKAAAVRSYLIDFVESIEQDEKFLVFAHHHEMLDAIERVIRVDCKKSIKRMVRIDGRTPPEARMAAVDQFQQDDDCRVAVLGITAAGVGLTLTKATTVIFAELTWTPGALHQCEARAHRIGQQCDVVIKYLIAHGTLEEDVWAMVSTKIDNLSQVLDSDQSNVGMAAQRVADDEALDQSSTLVVVDEETDTCAPSSSSSSSAASKRERNPSVRDIADFMKPKTTSSIKRKKV